MDTNPNSTRLHVTADVVIDRPDDAREVPSGAENALEISGRVTQARTGGGCLITAAARATPITGITRSDYRNNRGGHLEPTRTVNRSARYVPFAYLVTRSDRRSYVCQGACCRCSGRPVMGHSGEGRLL
jgi:hypothetical protein